MTTKRIKVGEEITIKGYGVYRVTHVEGWGSDGKSARLQRIGKKGQLLFSMPNDGLNLSESQLNKIGYISKHQAKSADIAKTKEMSFDDVQKAINKKRGEIVDSYISKTPMSKTKLQKLNAEIGELTEMKNNLKKRI